MVQVVANDSQLRHLIPDYIDTLALFISNINEVSVITVVICLTETYRLSCDQSVQSLHIIDRSCALGESVEQLRHIALEPF